MFNKETKKKARNGRSWRLLILDGHGSHVTLRFINYCEANRILIIILPAHSTSQLQPLDIRVFRPLTQVSNITGLIATGGRRTPDPGCRTLPNDDDIYTDQHRSVRDSQVIWDAMQKSKRDRYLCIINIKKDESCTKKSKIDSSDSDCTHFDSLCCYIVEPHILLQELDPYYLTKLLNVTLAIEVHENVCICHQRRRALDSRGR